MRHPAQFPTTCKKCNQYKEDCLYVMVQMKIPVQDDTFEQHFMEQEAMCFNCRKETGLNF